MRMMALVVSSRRLFAHFIFVYLGSFVLPSIGPNRIVPGYLMPCDYFVLCFVYVHFMVKMENTCRFASQPTHIICSCLFAAFKRNCCFWSSIRNTHTLPLPLQWARHCREILISNYNNMRSTLNVWTRPQFVPFLENGWYRPMWSVTNGGPFNGIRVQ